MSQQIPVEKRVFGKDFSKIIDTRFKQLTGDEELEEEITVDQFFEIYERLFYNIPKEGDINSHTYMLERSAQYLGISLQNEVDVQALLDEITELRQELLQANTLLNENNINIVNI